MIRWYKTYFKLMIKSRAEFPDVELLKVPQIESLDENK